MSDQQQLRLEVCARLGETARQTTRAFVGLDGAQDNILHPVAQRHDYANYDRMRTMTEFAERIGAAAGRSGNIEWVTQQVKMGGNGPLMALGLGHLGTRLHVVGALGSPEPAEIFMPLAEYGELISLCENQITDAAEFEDGKLMFGKLENFVHVRWARLLEVIGGEEKLGAMLANCDLVGLTNWTMVPFSNEIYENIARVALERAGERAPIFFFDFADPAKRKREDLAGVLALMKSIRERGLHVILGMNHNEALQVGAVLGVDVSNEADDPATLCALAEAIHAASGLSEIVIHPRARAAAANEAGSWCVEGPFTANPKLSTGAGDHFNGGYCFGRMRGFTPEQALITGVATSGYYVRNAQGPNPEQMQTFLTEWAKETVKA